MTAVPSETTRVIKSMTAVLPETTTIRALNSGFGCFDAILRDDLLRGIARLVFLVAPSANHRDVLLTDAIGFESVLGLLRRDFATAEKNDQVSKPHPDLSGETFSSESRRACAWDRRSPA
jgi:hypothetical protein